MFVVSPHQKSFRQHLRTCSHRRYTSIYSCCPIHSHYRLEQCGFPYKASTSSTKLLRSYPLSNISKPAPLDFLLPFVQANARLGGFWSTMAASFSHSMGDGQNFRLPIPPPPLHTRSSNDMHDCPSTPTQEPFMSPHQTPQGSPSKHHYPPGSFDLPNVFDNAMRLVPTITSPLKSGRPSQSPTSPNKTSIQAAEDIDYSAQDLTAIGPGSPTRKANKENTPPGVRPGMQKETSFINHAAASRQEPYKPRETDQLTRHTYSVQRGLSPEELEKLRKPSVKRLANVTQLCKSGRHIIS